MPFGKLHCSGVQQLPTALHSPHPEHVPCAGGSCSATLVHVPSCPKLLQALHCAVHVVAQQTPSAHTPDAHSLFTLHGCALFNLQAFETHV